MASYGSGSKPFRPARRPFVPNAKDTSADVQTMISEPPAPFKNNLTAANVPAPPNRAAEHPYGLPAKELLPKTAGARVEQQLHCGDTQTTDDMLAAVGEPRLPRGYYSVTSGFPVPGVARQTGPDRQPRRGRR